MTDAALPSGAGGIMRFVMLTFMLTCYMLKHPMRHILLFSSLIATWLKKKTPTTVKSNKIKSNVNPVNLLEFTHVEVSNHYLSFQN